MGDEETSRLDEAIKMFTRSYDGNGCAFLTGYIISFLEHEHKEVLKELQTRLLNECTCRAVHELRPCPTSETMCDCCPACRKNCEEEI
jgi:hypothetical protein